MTKPIDAEVLRKYVAFVKRNVPERPILFVVHPSVTVEDVIAALTPPKKAP
jgi:hypothetical protein